MNKFVQGLKSKTVWTLVIMFLFNGLQAIQPEVSGTMLVVVNAVLSVIAIIAKLYPSQDYSN